LLNFASIIDNKGIMTMKELYSYKDAKNRLLLRIKREGLSILKL